MPSKSTKAFKRNSLSDLNVSGKHDSYHTIEFGDAATFKSTGGTITEPGNGYRYHFFTDSTQAEQLVVSLPVTYDIVVVGGGGGGGGQAGGGGGAGGYREFTSKTFTAGSYNIIVGAGGPNSPDNGRGFVGSATTVHHPDGPMVSAGGGYGGGGSGSQPGGDGGSGGGGRVRTPSPAPIPGGSGNTPPVSPPQGNDGGANGGGGGGAGANGGPGSDGGGDGVAAFSGDTGIPSDYGTDGPSAGRWFAGGGAGGPGGGGGVGGGGGSNTAGTTNTGGGGGGAPNPGTGRAGGSGIVILKQLIPT